MEFEIFRAGIHTDTNGAQKEFTEADLDFIASSYNPKLHEAPLVIGHPKNNAPAYGWVESLKRSGQTLLAKVSSIVPEFLESVKQGLFKKRSIALNSDGTLRHIGFLGAVPPAVKGLKDLQFSEDAPFFEFSSEIQDDSHPDAEVHTNHDNPINHSSDSFPLPSESQESAPPSGSLPLSQAPDETSASSEFAALSAQENTVRQKVLDNIERLYFKQRKAEFEIYLSEKLACGNVTPAMQKPLSKLLEALSASSFNHEISGYVFEFSDESKEDPVNILKEFIDALPRIITFEEVAVKPSDISPQAQNDFSGFSVDSEAMELHEQITKLSKVENISYFEALNKLKSN